MSTQEIFYLLVDHHPYLAFHLLSFLAVLIFILLRDRRLWLRRLTISVFCRFFPTLCPDPTKERLLRQSAAIDGDTSFVSLIAQKMREDRLRRFGDRQLTLPKPGGSDAN